jgi:TonB family protein
MTLETIFRRTVLLAVLLATPVLAQGTGRKVKDRVLPVFPELARRMNLKGAVRIEAVVAPNGKVKSTKVLGGSPVLVLAAQSAVERWRFEPAAQETTETIELLFTE